MILLVYPTVSESDAVTHSKQADHKRDAQGCPACRKFTGSLGSEICNDAKNIVFEFLIRKHVTRAAIVGDSGRSYFTRYVYGTHYATPHTVDDLYDYHSWDRIEMGPNDNRMMNF